MSGGKYDGTYLVPTFVREVGLTEIIGKDDQVDQNELSGTVDLTVAASGLVNGEIKGVILITSETGTGAILTPAGKLFFLDADPNTSPGDAALSLAELQTVLGIVDVAAGDWQSFPNGAICAKTPGIPFHDLATIHAVWRHTDATSFNDAAGDDEAMHINVWYGKA